MAERDTASFDEMENGKVKVEVGRRFRESCTSAPIRDSGLKLSLSTVIKL